MSGLGAPSSAMPSDNDFTLPTSSAVHSSAPRQPLAELYSDEGDDFDADADGEEEEDSFDEEVSFHALQLSKATVHGGAASLEWCSAYLERDDLTDLDGGGGEDEELVDLRREYGAVLDQQMEKHLPTLHSKMQIAPEEQAAPAEEQQASLLRDGDEPEVEDDWDMLGLQCDCECRSCRDTFVATDFDAYQQHEAALASDNAAVDEDDAECECLVFSPPDSLHVVLLDLLEDFFRFRIHLHRVTFATSASQAQRSASNLRLEEQSAARRVQYVRSLTLLKARARRDLKHLELLEACANSLGWNQPDSPAYSVTPFCEVSPPGPTILSGVIIDFLTYFLVHKTTCSNFDKAKITSLCSNLATFAIQTGDLDASHRVTIECLGVCDRSMLDLPLADLIETELYNHVQERQDRAAIVRQHANAATMPVRLSERDAADAEIFPTAASSSAAIHRVVQGYWLLESFTAASSQGGRAGRIAGGTPALLYLSPALATKSKMAIYGEMEQMEKRQAQRERRLQDQSSTGPTNQNDAPAAAAPSKPASSPSLALATSGLSCSDSVRVVVPSSVISLLSESSDAGVGWQFNLELTQYGNETAPFHITKSGHVNCA